MQSKKPTGLFKNEIDRAIKAERIRLAKRFKAKLQEYRINSIPKYKLPTMICDIFNVTYEDIGEKEENEK